jgi:hypothetical protein
MAPTKSIGGRTQVATILMVMGCVLGGLTTWLMFRDIDLKLVSDQLVVEKLMVNGVEWTDGELTIPAGQIVKISGRLRAVKKPFAGDLTYEESQEHARLAVEVAQQNGEPAPEIAEDGSVYHVPIQWIRDRQQCDRIEEAGVIVPTILVLYGKPRSQTLVAKMVPQMLRVAISKDGSTAEFLCDSEVPKVTGKCNFIFALDGCDGASRSNNGLVSHSVPRIVFIHPANLVKGNEIH